MMKLNLETIILFVQDVERLKSFYADTLKLEILEETQSEWLLLKAGNCNCSPSPRQDDGISKIG